MTKKVYKYVFTDKVAELSIPKEGLNMKWFKKKKKECAICSGEWEEIERIAQFKMAWNRRGQMDVSDKEKKIIGLAMHCVQLALSERNYKLIKTKPTKGE